MTTTRPIDILFRRTTARVLEDGVITDGEVSDLEKLARDSDGRTDAVRTQLQGLLKDHASAFESSAALERARALALAPPERRAPTTDLFRYEAPPDHHQLRAHDLFIQRDGVLRGHTGLESFSRGWGRFNAGVLGRAHGSRVPASAVHDASERAVLDSAAPGARLDAAARALGVEMPWSSFCEIAGGFERPDQPDWAGVCYSWAWAALDARLSKLVDVDGPVGERGVWIGGQFLSRADLGNWLMALAAGVSQGAGTIMWYAPEAEDLLKATLGYLMDGQPGFRADIGNSFSRGSEIWFQPFVGADVEIESVDDAARRAVLDVAARPRPTAWGTTAPGVEGADVKLVHIAGQYGNEARDDHEGAPVVSEIEWAMYAVLDAEGKLLKAFMVDDERLQSAPGLPVRESNAVPRVFFKADHQLVDGILEGEPSSEVKNSVYGPFLDFFVGHVLARGVPATERRAFEDAVASAPPGPLSLADTSSLRARFPTMASAYSPEEWARVFAPRGLAADDFGR
jgi:hypothetical protein